MVKKTQQKEVATVCMARDTSPTQSDGILFVLIVYLHYCVTSESRLDTKSYIVSMLDS